MIPIDPSEITPERVYLSRRRFIRAFGGLTLAQLVLGACRTRGVGVGVVPAERATDAAASTTGGLGAGTTPEPGATVAADELGDPLTDFADVSGYTNYYEFSIDKDGPARLARGLVTTPWAVAVGGMVARPGTFDVADLGRRFGIEERVYRMRCVEGWSMVIPWLGFPLRRLLDLVEPASGARYVRFESILDPDRFPGQRDGLLPWPYVEGLRLDEARHDLVLLATGLYGRDLPPQNGAPIRLVVPWKYGFKSIKAIVKIDLVADRPTSTWMASAPDEYGFFANVNPEVDHPRWSQATERRIGELLRRRTLKFNGYADEVAQLYAGMDLRADF